MLLRSGVVVAAFTLLSRIFGLIRELFVAALFGTEDVADCVNVAFKFPNLFRRIFGEGALSAVFVPVFNQKLLKSHEEAILFGNKIFSLLFPVLVIITVILELIMPYIVLLIAPGFSRESEKFLLAVDLCRITTPYLIFISVTALFGGMLNSVKKFAAFAFTPVLMNIGIIGFTLLLARGLSFDYSIALALSLTGVLQCVFIYLCTARAGMIISFTRKVKDKDVISLLHNFVPAIISSGLQQLNLFISQCIASFIPGAISILAYADRLYQLPLSLIGITLSTVLLPELSQLFKAGNRGRANSVQNNGLKAAFGLSLPATVGLFFLAEPIIDVIYRRGAFTDSDTVNAAAVLAGFSLGLPAFSATKILISSFYASGDTSTPLRITLYSLVLNTLLNIILMMPFGYVGIAYGSSIAAWIGLFLAAHSLVKTGQLFIQASTKIFFLKILFNSILMLAAIMLAKHYLMHSFSDETIIRRIFILAVTVGCAITLFTATCYFQQLHKSFTLGKNETKL